MIRPTGFYRNKAKSLAGMAHAVVERHGGEIPDRLEALLQPLEQGLDHVAVVAGVVAQPAQRRQQVSCELDLASAEYATIGVEFFNCDLGAANRAEARVGRKRANVPDDNRIGRRALQASGHQRSARAEKFG